MPELYDRLLRDARELEVQRPEVSHHGRCPRLTGRVAAIGISMPLPLSVRDTPRNYLNLRAALRRIVRDARLRARATTSTAPAVADPSKGDCHA